VEETRTFWKLKKAEPDGPVRRTRFASGNGLVVKTEYMMMMVMMVMMMMMMMMMIIIIIIIIIIVHASFYSLSAYLFICNLNY
jgi:hypothetical protein